MEHFSEIDLMDLEPWDVDNLTTKEAIILYKDVVLKCSHDDLKRIRPAEYWEIKDRRYKYVDKMKLLIFCYIMDRNGEPVDWDHLKRIIQDERIKESAIKPQYNENRL